MPPLSRPTTIILADDWHSCLRGSRVFIDCGLDWVSISRPGAAICSKAGLLTVITLELRWFGSNRAPGLVLIDRKLNWYPSCLFLFLFVRCLVGWSARRGWKYILGTPACEARPRDGRKGWWHIYVITVAYRGKWCWLVWGLVMGAYEGWCRIAGHRRRPGNPLPLPLSHSCNQTIHYLAALSLNASF